MTAVNFGVGTIIGRRTDTSNPTPAFMGVMQDIEIDFDQTLKELMGQYKMPVDVAPANLKVTGKAKFAQIQANMVNDLILGQTLTTASGQSMAIAEAVTIPATPYQNTVSHAATFKEDLGVFKSSSGVQFKRVASGPTTGQYSVNETTGVYTFAAADTTFAMLIYYTYGITTQTQITMANQLLGVGPSFELNIQETYTNSCGTVNSLYIRLNACRSSKFTFPFKNVDYTIPDFDFQAFADCSNNWGLMSFSE